MNKNNMICPYCGNVATLRSSKLVYGGRDFGNMFICNDYPRCDSYVGVHKANNKPLGRLANAELRHWKKLAHAHFDPLWQRKLAARRAGKPGKSKNPGGQHYKKGYARGSAYKWLANELGIDFKDCHIGMFDVELCKRVIDICKPYLKIGVEK